MEQIEYTRTVVPSSMRSPYWKYFGFPSDNGNNILTRQKIVCTICNTAIAYNKNTSNLRTHLMSKHVEIFKKIVTKSIETVVAKQDTFCYENIEQENSTNESGSGIDYVNNLNAASIKRQRIETHNVSEVNPPVQTGNHFVNNCLILPEYDISQTECSSIRLNSQNLPISNTESAPQNTDYIAFLPQIGSEIGVSETCTEAFNTSNVDYRRDETALTYPNLERHESNDQQQNSVEIMLADLVQTDLLTLDTLEENGFCKYNQQLTGLTISADTINRVKLLIESRYTNIKQIITCQVHRLSQSQPYSLSFEIYKDNEGQDILNIYFNYLNDKQMDLISILYSSDLIGIEGVNISEVLAEINLKNCSGVVISSSDNVVQFVSDFAKINELPLIECLESVLTRCLQKIFDQTEFNADCEKFLKTILGNRNEIHLKKPNFRSHCKWSTLTFLENIFQSLEQNKLEKWSEFRQSFEYLKPLKMASDIIMEEPLPLSSLCLPLIKKLFEEHFNFTNTGESRISKIQRILEKELYGRIMAQNFLNEVTFFDTRFHRDFSLQEPLSDITNLKAQIVQRFKNILEVHYINTTNSIKIEQTVSDSLMNNRKCSSLKSFLKGDVSLPNTEDTTDLKTNLDLEFEQYCDQACLDLDQSPILWWHQQTENYEQLSKIAKIYLTIPCCCLPRLCRIDTVQRYTKLNRRKNLSQFCSTESILWYLYYNEDATVSL